MAFGGIFGGFRPAFDAGGAVGWWYVAGKTCVAAYQPKGAASLAASYVNLANPGTYNAAVLEAAPSFDTTVGWKFDTAGSIFNRSLTTGITPTNDQTWSFLLRYSGMSDSYVPMIGNSHTSNPRFGGMSVSSKPYYFGGGEKAGAATWTAAGVIGVAGNQGYFAGSADGATIGTAAGSLTTIWIAKFGSSSYAYYNVQALAIYSNVLSAGDVAALTTKMNAL